ncbi:hypothetical protein GQ44DRAFT_250597 [Phaeosphaeriaceae sp. PMI808]|nr:hypothetical protein GQ44DRAFT_250597 [Phaeosphaeriaceae sp. PMI808]
MDERRAKDPASKTLTPPISNISPLDAASSTLHIAFERDKHLLPNRDPSAYLTLELTTPRLNGIHKHLWLAGRPDAARPLHRQRLLGRNILVTEDPDDHLVWFEEYIFIKPLPDFLLDWGYWNNNLCSDQELHKAACGLLLSYAWIIRYRSDLNIAKESGLLSKDMEWPKWVEFLNAFLDSINCETLTDVNKRYHYGELRLSRLNSIYRLIPPTYSLRNVIRGYRSGSTWYQAFFERHFKWMLGIFAVLSVLLSALQLGLATTMLQGNQSFQKASYGFAIASLVAGAASVLLVFL